MKINRLKKKIKTLRSKPRVQTVPVHLQKIVEENTSKAFDDIIPSFKHLLDVRIGALSLEMADSLEDISLDLDKKIDAKNTEATNEVSSIKKTISSLFTDLQDLSEVIKKFSIRDNESFEKLNIVLTSRVESVLSKSEELGNKVFLMEKQLGETVEVNNGNQAAFKNYEESLNKKVADLETWLKKKSSEIFEFGSMMQVLANGIFKGQAITFNFKDGTNTTVSVSPNASTGNMDVSVNATGGGTWYEETLTRTDGINYTLAHTPGSIVLLFLNGQKITSGVDFNRTGTAVVMTYMLLSSDILTATYS